MTPGLPFGRKIRTTRAAQPTFPVFLETVEAAIDSVQELPEPAGSKVHWLLAKAALWAAADNPADQAKLKLADETLCRALKAEGWLNELRIV